MKKFAAAMIAGLLALPPAAATAQGDDAFYKGRTVSIVVGFAPGGSYDTYARLLGRHIGRHIPGEPTIVAQNMPGAGSMTAVRHLDANAPKDGTVLTAFNAGLITASLSEPEKFNFKFSDLGWVGSSTRDFSVCYAWHTTGINSLADAVKRPQFIIGGTARGSSSSINSAILTHIFGVKVKSILGYTGSAESRLAIERGELEGHCGSWVSLPKEWRTEKKIAPFVRFSHVRLPDMPEEAKFVGDLVTDEEQKRVLDFLLAATEVGRPYVVSQQVPAERLAVLRTAFMKTMADPELLKEAEKQGLPISPIAGEESGRLIAAIYGAPATVVEKGKAILK